ncbi:hypothetical protein EMIT0P43_210048 [Pseudomonas jessenii]
MSLRLELHGAAGRVEFDLEVNQATHLLLAIGFEIQTGGADVTDDTLAPADQLQRQGDLFTGLNSVCVSHDCSLKTAAVYYMSALSLFFWESITHENSVLWDKCHGRGGLKRYRKKLQAATIAIMIS